MLKRFVRYYKPHRLLFALDMLASLLVSLIAVVYPMITRIMLNDFIPNRKYGMIVSFGLALLVLYVIRMLLNYFIQYKGHVMGVRIQAQMRSDLFNHIQKLPFSFFDNNETGIIMSRPTDDLFDISELAHHGPENFIITTISIIVSFVYLSTINLWLSLIIFVCVPLLIAASMVARKKMNDAFRASRRAVAEINGAASSVSESALQRLYQLGKGVGKLRPKRPVQEAKAKRTGPWANTRPLPPLLPTCSTWWC